MKIVDNLADKLYLDVSKIPGAGVGLFTGKKIQAGVPVCEYKGDVFDNTREDMDLLNKRYNYTLVEGVTTRSLVYSMCHTPSKKIVDANPYFCKNEVGMGSFTNDAENCELRKNRPKEFDKLEWQPALDYWTKAGYNCYYWSLPNEPKLFLLSFKTIEEGEEILVDYGCGYWEMASKRAEEIASLKETREKERTILDSPLGETIKDALKNAKEK